MLVSVVSVCEGVRHVERLPCTVKESAVVRVMLASVAKVFEGAGPFECVPGDARTSIAMYAVVGQLSHWMFVSLGSVVEISSVYAVGLRRDWDQICFSDAAFFFHSFRFLQQIFSNL